MYDYNTEGYQTYCTLNEIVNKKSSLSKWGVKLAPDANGSAKMIYSYVKNRKFIIVVSVGMCDLDSAMF